MNDIIKSIKPARCSHHTVSMGRCQNCGHDYQAATGVGWDAVESMKRAFEDRDRFRDRANRAHLAWKSARERDRVTQRAAQTLGKIIDRQITDLLHWAGMDDQIGLDDPDQQTAWELVAGMPDEIKTLQIKLNEAIRAREIAQRDLRNAQAEIARLRGDR